MTETKLCVACNNSKVPADMFWSTMFKRETKTCYNCRQSAIQLQRVRAAKSREHLTRHLRCDECGDGPTLEDRRCADWDAVNGYLTYFRGRRWCSACLLEPSEPNHIGKYSARFKIDQRPTKELPEFMEQMFTPEENRRWNKNLAALQERLRNK